MSDFIMPRVSELPKPKGHVQKWPWRILIDGVEIAQFMTCSPITTNSDNIVVAEGGNKEDWNEPGRVKKDNITLTHGETSTNVLYKAFMAKLAGKLVDAFITFDIQQYDTDCETVICTWRLNNAYINGWESGDFDAGASDIKVQTMTIIPNDVPQLIE